MNVWSVLCSTPKYQRATYIIVHNRVIYIIRQKKGSHTHTHTRVYLHGTSHWLHHHTKCVLQTWSFSVPLTFSFSPFRLLSFSFHLFVASFYTFLPCSSAFKLTGVDEMYAKCITNIEFSFQEFFPVILFTHGSQHTFMWMLKQTERAEKNKNRNKNSTQIRRRQGESDLTLNQLHGDSLFVCVY